MNFGIYSSLSAMKAQQTRMDVSANNTANVSTTAFKARRVDLAEAPVGANGVGMGVSVAATPLSTTQGPLRRTDNPSDLAVMGRGYFEVENTGGEVSYTRDGAFNKDADGFLRTSSGEYLRGQGGARVQIPADSVRFSIGRDGTVTSMDANGNTANVGTVGLSNFSNENGLSAKGGGLFSPTDASGPAQAGVPGQNGFGGIESGALELSNVSFIQEAVVSISAQRAFEANAAALRTSDEMLSRVMDKS